MIFLISLGSKGLVFVSTHVFLSFTTMSNKIIVMIEIRKTKTETHAINVTLQVWTKSGRYNN